jgi:rhodanese-related sulfurtransferase
MKHNNRSRLLTLLAITLFCCQAFGQNIRLSPAEFEKAIDSKSAQLLDVRTADEYKAGHIPHSLQANWNNQKEFTNRAQHLDKSKPLYVYCGTGVRSKAAAEWFRNNGYTGVYELTGGFIKWKADGKPVEGMPAEKSMTLQEFTAAVSGTGITLVNIGGNWCPPCRKMEPVLTQLQQELPGKFTLLKVNAAVHTDVVKQLQATEFPTFILYKNGKELWRKQGIIAPDELKQEINRQ